MFRLASRSQPTAPAPAEIANKTGGWGIIFWHMNCGKKFMARKMTALKYAQEFGGEIEIPNRRSTPQLMPYPVPFHPQTRISPPKRRLEIAVEVKTGTEAPATVKIIHAVYNLDSGPIR
jgi:hypothetical protein